MNMKIVKALMICMVISIIMTGIAFASTVSNIYYTPEINGYEYYFTSEVWDRYYSPTLASAEGVASIRCIDRSAPTGYMGGHGRLFTSTGTLWCSGLITYNTAAVSNHYNYSPRTYIAGLYYAQSRAFFYNGDGYDAYTGYTSPILTLISTPSSSYDSIINSAERVLDEICSRTSYEKNENGETYGSALSAETIGVEPDLIAAIGTNGVEGYVRSSDFATGVMSPEEAIVYMDNLSDSISIPLYDVNGSTVLGEFVLKAK